MSNSQDNSYLKQLEAGSIEAFDALYLKYHPRLKAFLISFIKDEEIASDIAQDIFMKIWINRGSISEISNFSTYIYSSAKYSVYNYFKRNLIKEKYIASLQNMPNYADFLEEDVTAEELNRIIQKTIENMPARRREIFILSRQNGMSNQEIADKLNISKRTIENQITMALAMLRKVIMAAKVMLIFLFGFMCVNTVLIVYI